MMTHPLRPLLDPQGIKDTNTKFVFPDIFTFSSLQAQVIVQWKKSGDCAGKVRRLIKKIHSLYKKKWT